jgi:hypothetical protein
MSLVNENILVGAGVTLAGMCLAMFVLFVFLALRLLSHLQARLECWRYLRDIDLQIAKEKVKVAHLRYGLRAPLLSLPKDFDFPLPDKKA